MRYEVILDWGETANKCTIAPLSYRPDFQLFPVTHVLTIGPLSSTVLLHHEGQCLTTIRRSMGEVKSLAAVDCVWRRLPGLLNRIQAPLPRFARIPDGFVTVYPRRSAYNRDPDGGLATIEALFVAAAVLGCWDTSLLSRYYFGRAFVERNANRFLELGIREALDPTRYPVYTRAPRSSDQRRRDRGRDLKLQLT